MIDLRRYSKILSLRKLVAYVLCPLLITAYSSDLLLLRGIERVSFQFPGVEVPGLKTRH